MPIAGGILPPPSHVTKANRVIPYPFQWRLQPLAHRRRPRKLAQYEPHPRSWSSPRAQPAASARGSGEPPADECPLELPQHGERPPVGPAQKAPRKLALLTPALSALCPCPHGT